VRERELLERLRAAGNSWSGTAENVAPGQRDEEEAISAWIKSREYRANMLDINYTHIEHGMTIGSRGTKYWTQNFGFNPCDSKNIPKC
jgi:uncharacterized protein YkwD